MTSEAVRSRILSNPFLPLRIRTTQGCEYRVALPDELALFGPDDRKVLVFNGSGQQVQLANVVSIVDETVPGDFVPAGNDERGARMTIEKFDEFLKRQPFVPFTIHVADGDSFSVKGPEFVSRTENGRTIFVATGDDRTQWIDLLLVTRISSGVNNPSVSKK